MKIVRRSELRGLGQLSAECLKIVWKADVSVQSYYARAARITA